MNEVLIEATKSAINTVGKTDLLLSSSTFRTILQIIGTILPTSIVTILLTRHFERSSERRALFASAYKSALSWQEMLYRVRRRSPGIVEEKILVNRFHDIQEELNYYQGIISSESVYLGRSYKKLVTEIKKQNSELIQKAWASKLRKPQSGTPKNDVSPSTTPAQDDFLKDIRDWLSINIFLKLFVIFRNRHEPYS